MLKPKSLLLALVALALALAACGSGETDDTSDELPVDDGSGNAAGACLVGAEDCDDLGPLPTDDEPLFTDDEPITQGPDDDGLVLGGGMSIDEALANDIDGGFAIMGFYFDDGSGPKLCDALAESFPPQCGGPSIPIDNSVGVELDGLQTNQGVTWTDQPAVLVGEIVDGVFVVQDV